MDGTIAEVDKNSIYSVVGVVSGDTSDDPPTNKNVEINSLGTILTVGGTDFGYDKNGITWYCEVYG